jgi:hypothetical protein
MVRKLLVSVELGFNLVKLGHPSFEILANFSLVSIDPIFLWIGGCLAKFGKVDIAYIEIVFLLHSRFIDKL